MEQPGLERAPNLGPSLDFYELDGGLWPTRIEGLQMAAQQMDVRRYLLESRQGQWRLIPQQ